MPSLSVVIPARNEQGRIGSAIRAVHETLTEARIAHEIIVVNDASTDGTAEEVRAEARALRDQCPVELRTHRSSTGKGGAVATGFLATRGDFAAFIDADLEFPPQALVAMWQTALSGPDPRGTCSVGERRGDARTIIERITSQLARLAIRTTLRLPLADTQAGVKLFPGWFAREVLAISLEAGWMFDVEALLLARQYGLHMTSVPLTQSRVRPRRATTVEYLRCGITLVRLALARRATLSEIAATRSR